MKNLTILLLLFTVFVFADWDVDPDYTTLTADSVNAGKLVVDTITGDIITDGFIRNARLQSIDSIPDDSVKGYVTFTFDDGSAGHYDSIFPMFTDSGEVGVLAICTNTAKLGGATDWTRIKEMYNAGWEIASHTVNHAYLTVIAKDSADWELRRSQEIFAEQGIDAKSYVHTGGVHNELVRRLTAKYYNCARAGGAGGTGRVIPPVNTFALKSIFLNENSQVAAAKAWIDTVVIDRSWAIFMTHTIATATISVNSVAEVLSYAQTQGLQVVTLQQGLQYMGNKIEVGDSKFMVGKDGKMKYNATHTVNLWNNTLNISSGTKNTISSIALLEGMGTVPFDSMIIDSVFVLATAQEDSNIVDSTHFFVWTDKVLAGGSAVKEIVTDGTDWGPGAVMYMGYTYVCTVTINTGSRFGFKFKPGQESAANKMLIYNVILYGRPK